jgi:hypothetical protein
MALSIFALWRIDYEHTVDLAAHTLHEVLDIASNFGLALADNLLGDYTAALARATRRAPRWRTPTRTPLPRRWNGSRPTTTPH